MTDEEILAQRVTIYMSCPIVERDGQRFLQVVLFGRTEELRLPREPDDPEEGEPTELC